MMIFDEMEHEHCCAVLDHLVSEIKEKFLDKACAYQTTELDYGPYTIRYVLCVARHQYESGIRVAMAKEPDKEKDLCNMALHELEDILKEVSKE